ncbi:MAG: cytochrome c [Psychroserpens sp.]|uniref:c-type cytochrome n=1 Tax=Psychroserpens sp. TaxID=2020870 RepID=UPI003003929F
MKLNLVTLFVFLVFVSCNSSEKKKDISEVILSAENNSLQNPKLTESMKRGKSIYADFCMSCHLPNGKGVPKAFPPLAKSDYLMANREESIKSIKYGQSGEITVNGVKYNGVMAALGLEDEEVADVMNYIMNSWGNSNDKLISVEEISKIKE